MDVVALSGTGDPSGGAVAAPRERSRTRSAGRRGRTTLPGGGGAAAGGDGAAHVGAVVQSIGPKLRQLRTQRRLSLHQLAELSQVSPAAIHKIERASMVPTVTTLIKLATALGRPVSYFVEEGDVPEGPAVFIPAASWTEGEACLTGRRQRSISGPYGRFFITATMAVMEPHAESDRTPSEHPGEELIYLLKGTLDVEVDGRTFRLRSGDALHFRADRRHRWRNPRARRAEAVWMALVPT
jgi:transcriptional regulator with XRE-family HTH domain